MSISAEACKIIEQQLDITFNTTLQTIQHVGEIKPSDKYEIKVGKITNTLLGCIVIALLTQARVSYETAEKSMLTLVKPS